MCREYDTSCHKKLKISGYLHKSLLDTYILILNYTKLRKYRQVIYHTLKPSHTPPPKLYIYTPKAQIPSSKPKYQNKGSIFKYYPETQVFKTWQLWMPMENSTHLVHLSFPISQMAHHQIFLVMGMHELSYHHQFSCHIRLGVA